MSVNSKRKALLHMENVVMQSLSNREARNVAQMLKRRGYGKVTIESCDGRSAIEIAGALEPYDPELQKSLADDIAAAAGLKPKKGRRS